MLKAVAKWLWLFIYNVLEWIIKVIYLLLPFGLHIFALQMRQLINPVTTLTTFIPPDSTWTMVYDGVVLVNTNVGAVRRRLNNVKNWFKTHSVLLIAFSIIILLGMVGIILIKIL